MSDQHTTGLEKREDKFDPFQLTRPDRALWIYYLTICVLTGPGFLVAILPLFFRYETLRYRFDDEGIAMSWGILFRREIYLTYRRIQDIHLTRNLLQRWFGITTISIQTASGHATPEMSIEGIRAAEALRDFLYTKMRSGKVETDLLASAAPEMNPADECLVLLREIRDSLRSSATETKGIV